ncbi:hypothetical protein HGO21_00945 [Acinetobacter sp. CUI P1]|nr:hypothetical protein [Acinetobacter sp. CUI P1]
MKLHISTILFGIRYNYAFTSTSSPFIALHKAITTGKLEREDKVLFWSMGAGWQNVAFVTEY